MQDPGRLALVVKVVLSSGRLVGRRGQEAAPAEAVGRLAHLVAEARLALEEAVSRVLLVVGAARGLPAAPVPVLEANHQVLEVWPDWDRPLVVRLAAYSGLA